MSGTLHRHLLDPATYRENGGQIEFRETHISRVYLTARHAFKFKKPLDLGFLDFSSLANRRHFCQEELRLNRRFCPEIYLDLVTLNRSAEGYRINGPGETLDYAVRMQRLPEERMLDGLLATCGDSDLTAEIDRLGDKLVKIYPTLPPFRASGDESHVAMMRANWQENFRQTRPYIGQTINDELFELGRRRVGRLLDRVEPVMARREKDGFVRDCHGDLHSRNICMTPKICIYDCIEFNRRFRVGDIIGDIAFLLMDLAFRDRRALSERLLEKAAPILGDTGDIDELIPFYKFYRAWVRGKVQSFLLGEEDTPEEMRREARQQAMKYFNLGFGELAPPGLILTCGLSGTGKTTVARALSAATGATLLRSDVIRKEIFGLDSHQAKPPGFNTGLYTAGKTARTYDELRKRSENILAEGGSVIADASFGNAAARHSFAALAECCKVPFAVLHTDCPRELALERLEKRRSSERDASDAGPEIYEPQAEAFERLSEEEAKIEVDTSQDVDYNVSLILLRYLKMTGTT